MTNEYKNVYVSNTSVSVGPNEKNGALNKYFDKTFDDFYFGQKTIEQAECFLIKENFNNLIKKADIKLDDINLIIGADLSNQLIASNYAYKDYDIPYFGVYNACSSSGEALIIASNFLDNNNYKKIIVSASSHNLTAEKQFRSPIEYGVIRKNYATFTTTASSSILLTNKKTDIKVESSTIGHICDMEVYDVNNMGAVMASSACFVLNKHLKDMKRVASYYDLILTGDLGKFGNKIMIKYMKEEFNIDVSNNCKDAGTLLYNNTQRFMEVGGSGCGCGSSVLFSFVFNQMRSGIYKKVLFIPTGALMNTTAVNQKLTIPSISHAISFEVIK